MTEEIIIECTFYKDGVCASPINKTCEYCKNIDVSKCYHKRLKRLEQDSKQLTQWLDEARKNADFWCDKSTSLEQENALLKEELLKKSETEQSFQSLLDENKELRAEIESRKGLITVGGKQQYQYLQRIDELEQENKELQKQNDEECLRVTNLAMENTKLEKEISIKKDAIVELNTKLHLETVGHDMAKAERIEAQKIGKKYKSALEEIRNYCNRIEQGSIIGTRDCLINSIKNIVNYAINEVQNEGK